ncbi:hypothetical protein L3X38_037983 [Prunus dulcis]|uniref:Protein FAR1-RELATED SEQUENCE n=1 Tax=Prunus dulcis TaxID=3755 RepID=A0AAD4V4D8_PRUDU|nr:hypothetical protein L3X38_037983 [Prunus dulcis]
MLPSHRRIYASQATEVDLTEESGIPLRQAYELMGRQVGGRESLGYIKQDQKNYLQTKRQRKLAYGEVGSLLKYFQNEALENPSSFLYAVQLDCDEQITNIFWADAKMIVDYGQFGDFVCFDTMDGEEDEFLVAWESMLDEYNAQDHGAPNTISWMPYQESQHSLQPLLNPASFPLQFQDLQVSNDIVRSQLQMLIKLEMASGIMEKETRVVLSVKMVSQQQTKDSGSKKLGMVAPQDKSWKEMKSSKKMKFASSSAETEPTSQTTISDDSKSTGRGMSTMPRVVKRKLQKLRPIVEYNKMGKGIGQAHIEMQSYIGVLARSRVPLVDKKWSQIPKDVKEHIWEAVDMAFVVGQGGKKSVLASAAKKWKDFKSTLTRHYILPYTNDKEKLSHPPETYKFIEKAQ